jgi:hypothetical protein
MTNNQADYE